MKNNTITIDGTEYVKADSISQPQTPGPWTLFIVDNGWVLIGKDDGCEPGSATRILEPWCVRTFGAGTGVESFLNDKRDEVVFDRWPSDVVTVEPGRLVMRSVLPEAFRAPG